ncbi:MAG: short-chain dehydrogenase [Zetaproteobacteria bacterium CG12_big_fil_rev_8_21_14_0_65_54_13]|nr:MAG: short-chain dehydrogenase [Zetaproteobacteria bacterium CG23_combo_of_CG06-09_8_20_14_all_54_7]PIW50756.1 MAG: short-chain dehydrogenase [Zetaproteobacteria bacterium CG12_big_fil_rev_8_21_14_0_65_54_13]PIX54203.1 MAG: short-chain dehydrogenase [Zetaproteobacteria bacterium CG_4_10_14_3_um_filter_54_28]PJA29068.1 MAG: short-chain dehydrogenase [Zetaproteobacteria bacterium CG_4_9_14_3_um_filter_54_145]
MDILITGAARGIGLGFVRYYIEQGHQVWACYRSDIGGLGDISSKQLHLLRWDVSCDDAPYGELPATIDLLINNAGIYGPGKDGQSLSNITSADMLAVFNIDCVGPLRVVQRLQSRLAHGSVIANISSKMGSSADNNSGGTYAYRAAKAGLIIVSKSMAVDLAPQGVHVITLHPGWVRTDMVQQTGLIDVSTSVAGMATVIASARSYDPGQFIAFDGKPIPY